jgi:hypothetical protein
LCDRLHFMVLSEIVRPPCVGTAREFLTMDHRANNVPNTGRRR